MVDLGSVRAPLFVPGDRPERFAKAAASGTDAVIIDLEDAVAEGNKDEARQNLRSDLGSVSVLVRVNASGTPWFERDISTVLHHDFAGVVLPKAEDVAGIDACVRLLNGSVPILALIETARGLANARDIARHAHVSRLVFGSVDYCLDIGCREKRDVLLGVRSELVLASRLADIAAPIDGVTVRLNDENAVREDATHARSLGMTGKLCIHPRQVAPVLTAFEATAMEIAWAKSVLASGSGTARVDGEMIDAPVRARAQRILNLIE